MKTKYGDGVSVKLNDDKKVVSEKCVDCVHYQEDAEGDNLKGHREKISLDGECWGYEKKD